MCLLVSGLHEASARCRGPLAAHLGCGVPRKGPLRDFEPQDQIRSDKKKIFSASFIRYCIKGAGATLETFQ